MNLRIKVEWEVSQVVYEDSKKEFDSELQKNNIMKSNLIWLREVEVME